MTLKFTSNHLVKYIYRETSVAETIAINEAMHEDANLRKQYQALKQGFQELPKVKFNPSSSVLQNILKYSEQRTVETH